jgi:hypothetical protein
MSKLILFLSALLLFVFTDLSYSYAQVMNERHSNVAFQLTAGTQGVGGDFHFGVAKQLSLRAGAAFIPVKANNVFTIAGFQSTNNVSVKFSNIHLMADLIPFANAQGFRLVAGAGYLYKATGGLEVIPTGTYNVGNYNLTAADLGRLNIDVSWKGVAPYLGIGLFKGIPKRRFNVNFDFGTYYLSQPRTRVIGTEMLADNYKLEPQFNSNLKNYRWMPVMQMNFNFRIR